MRKSFREFSQRLNFGMDRILPDALVLAMALTILTLVAGWVWTDSSLLDMIRYWGDGFWDFLSFGMQTTLIFATSYVVANAPASKRALVRLARIPKNGVQGVVFVGVVSALLGWVSWGLDLAAGAILARSIALHLRRVDFKLYVAVAYTGAITSGLFGISGSEFLMVNTPGYFMEEVFGLIPLSRTVFEPSLLTAQVLGLLVAVPALAALIHTKPQETPALDEKALDWFLEQDRAVSELKTDRRPVRGMTLAERLDNSPVTTLLIGGAGLIYVAYRFATRGFDLTLDMMNFILLMLGILLHGTPRDLLAAAEEGVRSAYGVVLQFPFYAGIQGMLTSSGLMTILASAFAGHATQRSFPYACYVCMAIVNFFIPSSGGIFMVAGPSLGQAALELGVDANKFLISFTVGETISNVIQPFWAVPLLGMVGLHMKDIMGYCMIFFVVLTLIFFGVWAVFW